MVSFAGDGVDLVIRNIIGVILLFMPFILLTIFNNIIVIERENKKPLFIKSGLCLISIGSFYLFLQIGKEKILLFSFDCHTKLTYKMFNNNKFIKTYVTSLENADTTNSNIDFNG